MLIFTRFGLCGRLVLCEQGNTSRFPLLFIVFQDIEGAYSKERGDLTLNNYEIAVIISTELDDKSLVDMKETIKDWIVSSGGEVALVDDRGRRKLAYNINKKREGHYVSWYAILPSSGPSEVERQMRLNENILRFMVIKSDIPTQTNEEPLSVEADSNVVETVPSTGISEEITDGDKVVEVDEVSDKEHEEESGQ